MSIVLRSVYNLLGQACSGQSQRDFLVGRGWIDNTATQDGRTYFNCFSRANFHLERTVLGLCHYCTHFVDTCSLLKFSLRSIHAMLERTSFRKLDWPTWLPTFKAYCSTGWTRWRMSDWCRWAPWWSRISLQGDSKIISTLQSTCIRRGLMSFVMETPTMARPCAIWWRQ